MSISAYPLQWPHDWPRTTVRKDATLQERG